MAKAVGIDLGTTNSAVAYYDGNRPTIIPSSEGDLLTPSIVAFTEDGKVLVGVAAARQAALNPSATIYSAKRFIGKRFADVEKERLLVPYEIAEGSNGGVAFKVRDTFYTPEQISAFILRKLVDDASAYLGHKVEQAIITVPAYFNDEQRQATKNAGEIAGVDVLRILNEPTAAALAYGLHTGKQQKILVFDLGGGTFDVSVLDVEGKLCEVCATSGDGYLGGDDFDHALLDHVLNYCDEKISPEIRNNAQALQRLREAVEKGKRDLSTQARVTIDLPFLVQGEKPIHFSFGFDRELLEELTAPIRERCIPPVHKALEDSKLAPEDVGEILLVGGSTRMPSVRSLVSSLIAGKEPSKGANPEEVVALGAAVQAGILQGDVDELVLLDVTPFSLGIATKESMTPLILRNTPIPVRASELFTTADHFQRGVDIVILEGEHRLASRNRELGRLSIDGIVKKVKGDARIEVTFDIDEDGILIVSAEDLDSGRKEKITIEGTARLPKSEVARMSKEFRNRKR